MTPQAALVELLARVGARNGAAVFISAEELSQWPATAVAAMKSQKLLTRARPAASVVCPGCEQQCVMPVRTMPSGRRGAASFIVCDKRSDINRVPVSAEDLAQWRCDAAAVCEFIAGSLRVYRTTQHPAESGLLPIGIAAGDKRHQMLCLQANGALVLVAGSNSVPLVETVGFCNGGYSVDGAIIRQLVDSATTADPRYTPSTARRGARRLDTQAVYQGWRKAYRELKTQRGNMSDVWYARQIAKTKIANRRSAETIRKHMKK